MRGPRSSVAMAGSALSHGGPVLRSTRCSVPIRSIGVDAAAPAAAWVHCWGAGAGSAGCSSWHGSTCTNPRTSCSASSRASCTNTPRRHPAQKRHLNRAERRVRYSAIQTPPTCSRGSAEPLGPCTQADRARPSRLRFPPAAPLGWDERPWTSARRGSPASETAGLDVLHRWPDAEPGGVRVLTSGVGQRTGDHRTQ